MALPRTEKAPRRPLGPFDPRRRAEPRVRLLYVGPVLEAAEGEALARALGAGLGAAPRSDRAWRDTLALERADVVLNCSISEGGMANSVLEAMALGRAVLAADIPGNRALVEPEVTGVLFSTDAELEAGALSSGARRVAARAARRGRTGAGERALPAEARSRAPGRLSPIDSSTCLRPTRTSGMLATRGPSPSIQLAVPMPPRWAVVSTPHRGWQRAPCGRAPDAQMIALTCACGLGVRGDVWRGPCIARRELSRCWSGHRGPDAGPYSEPDLPGR